MSPLKQPLKPPRQRVAPLYTRVRNGLPGGSETVLLVEDEASVRSSLGRVLSRQGYTVIEARNGAEALQILDQTSKPVDLVMTDLLMPQMTGLELIPELQARLKHIQIIVMSGFDENAAMQGGTLPAGVAFLEKPFTIERVLQAVRGALDGRAAKGRQQKGQAGDETSRGGSEDSPRVP